MPFVLWNTKLNNCENIGSGIKPRNVLITGASRGIGKSLSQLFKDQGYQVIAPSRSELDLADPKSLKDYIAKISNLKVDILINNAGINLIYPIQEIPGDVWDQILQINLTAPFQLIQAVVPHMIQNKWGRILNISSIYGLISRVGRAAYSTSKAGLNSLTRTSAVEFGEHQVLVNAICPGFVDTDMTHINNSEEKIRELSAAIPLRRLADIDEIARFAYFLCSEENTYITGQSIPIDGGFLCQ